MSDSLSHHGVKGMKWGVRKQRPSSSRGRSSRSSPVSAIKSKFSTAKKSKPKARPADEISDQELRSRINRLQMEKQYRDLLSGPSKSPNRLVERGRSTAENIIFNSVQNAGTALLTHKIEGMIQAKVDPTFKIKK